MIERSAAGKLLLSGGTVVDPVAGKTRPADVLVEKGRIVAVGSRVRAAGAERLDCTGKHVLPGLVDTHCHLREPGREDEETIATGTRAAIAGGFTRVCPMPNTEPPVDCEAAVTMQVERGAAADFARVHPIGACTRGRAGKELAEIGAMVRAGAVAVSDDGSPVSDAMVMRRCLEYCKAFDIPVISHCEVRELVEGLANEGRVATRLGLKTSPACAESAQAARDILLAEATGGRLHIAHVSAAGTVEAIRWGKARGVAVTAETCPHYFTLTDEAITGFDTNCKVNPPLRTEADRRAVVAALADGTIDCIATDHAPHLKGEKDAEWDAAPPGMTGFETAFSLGYEKLVLGGTLDLAACVALMTVRPARILGISLPLFEVGREVELAIVDLDETWQHTAPVSRSSNSPFIGSTLRGRVKAVIAGDSLHQF
jgi:dihydroorotase